MNVHAQMKGQMLIGGELVAGEAGNWLDSVNPANEEKIGEFPSGDAADVSHRQGRVAHHHSGSGRHAHSADCAGCAVNGGSGELS